ncbi:uncharacterized protein ACA1_363320 [Acanthamoeba castellanii str. Neff]|uniref:Uncharacterized protein n=1 Tax=Acanthamoeba castellanii (strain ATCC 30010 / Neff) TaxID=1257118 RepID=L8GFQ4_ACACF|nr:uncharacterized protein ACA1_363320 [Acanthamoeba castellanii str. Neff]ELR11832.1 hypothetical protein ACA1_363320 [Acanthamoeba castellanii str. Neff]
MEELKATKKRLRGEHNTLMWPITQLGERFAAFTDKVKRQCRQFEEEVEVLQAALTPTLGQVEAQLEAVEAIQSLFSTVAAAKDPSAGVFYNCAEQETIISLLRQLHNSEQPYNPLPMVISQALYERIRSGIVRIVKARYENILKLDDCLSPEQAPPIPSEKMYSVPEGDGLKEEVVVDSWLRAVDKDTFAEWVNEKRALCVDAPTTGDDHKGLCEEPTVCLEGVLVYFVPLDPIEGSIKNSDGGDVKAGSTHREEIKAETHEDVFAAWDAVCATLPKGLFRVEVEGLETDP